MGNCVPVQKSTDPAMKLKCTIISKGNSTQIESPVKDDTVNGDHSMVELNSMPHSSAPMPYDASFRDLSNRDENFFDSQPWLDSDCEDYLSVNGGSISLSLSPQYFTPSCGTTPIHQSSFGDTSRLEESLHISSTAKSVSESSTDMKKQLFELFKESFSSDLIDDSQNLHDRVETKPITFYLPQKSTGRSLYESVANSICNGDATPQRRSTSRKEKPARSAQCCLPNWACSLSFSERRKRLNHANIAGR